MTCPQLDLIPLLEPQPKPKAAPKPTGITPKEFKVVALRDCPVPTRLCDTPERVAEYWRSVITAHPYFNGDVETFTVIMVNTRRRIIGHTLISTGTLDTLLVHAREVFRPAIVANSAAIVLTHNLCVAAHKLCYVALRVMCSARMVGLTSLGPSGREECHGCI
jgi:hypothetical protein